MTDAEWQFVLPDLRLVRENAAQRVHNLRDLFDGLRWLSRSGAHWRCLPADLSPWHTVYQQARRWIDAGCFVAIVCNLRAMIRLAKDRAVKLPEAKRGFVLLPRRWVVERSFAGLARFRRFAKDYKRLPEVLAGMNFIAFSFFMLRKAAPLLATRA